MKITVSGNQLDKITIFFKMKPDYFFMQGR